MTAILVGLHVAMFALNAALALRNLSVGLATAKFHDELEKVAAALDDVSRITAANALEQHVRERRSGERGSFTQPEASA